MHVNVEVRKPFYVAEAKPLLTQSLYSFNTFAWHRNWLHQPIMYMSVSSKTADSMLGEISIFAGGRSSTQPMVLPHP